MPSPVFFIFISLSCMAHDEDFFLFILWRCCLPIRRFFLLLSLSLHFCFRLGNVNWLHSTSKFLHRTSSLIASRTHTHFFGYLRSLKYPTLLTQLSFAMLYIAAILGLALDKYQRHFFARLHLTSLNRSCSCNPPGPVVLAQPQGLSYTYSTDCSTFSLSTVLSANLIYNTLRSASPHHISAEWPFGSLGPAYSLHTMH
ncbi:hypothetical protein BJX66DRAFT_139008 [Aspergillus keveii]|uniref:Secreted protein n=1 Tax=Aspergillus keveii TaxID=714993 RepID=A0ABR4GBC4_9EURO